MAIRVGYALRESGTNLRRNVIVTFATVLTTAVSLALVGSALLLRSGVSNATQSFRNGVEMLVYVKIDDVPADATAADRSAAQARLASRVEQLKTELDGLRGREIKRYTFCNQDCALEEFTRLFRGQPEYLDVVKGPEDLPPSYRIVPAQAERLDDLKKRFERRAEVQQVVTAEEQVKTLLAFFGRFQNVILVLAVLLLLAAVLLVLNTIRVAIFSRRREVAVMKLVGATNWFIRVPFMLEGLLQGLFGSLFAFGLVAAANNYFNKAIQTVPLFGTFSVSNSQVASTGIFLLVLGALIGAAGSAIAVSRFLDV